MTYRCDSVGLDDRIDGLFAAALPIAMRRASALELGAPCSPAMLSAAPRVQAILSNWDQRLKEVRIRAKSRQGPTGVAGSETAAFFTGGVDSFYTVLRRRSEIDALIYVHGFDIALDELRKRELVSHSLRAVAERLALPLVEVATDLRALSNRTCNWERIYTSAALASVGHLLAGRFNRFLIPATHSYLDLHPTGTHPILDPLWSSEHVVFEHVDAVSRVDKLRVIAKSDLAMSSLRVCFQPGESGLNCGKCPKCLRTMTGLRVVGGLQRCGTLPDRLPLPLVGTGPVRSRRALTYVHENLRAAEAAGDDPALIFALRRLVRRGIRTEARSERRRVPGDLFRALRARVSRRR